MPTSSGEIPECHKPIAPPHSDGDRRTGGCELNGEIRLYRGNGRGSWQNGNSPDLIRASATTWNAMDKFMWPSKLISLSNFDLASGPRLPGR